MQKLGYSHLYRYRSLEGKSAVFTEQIVCGNKLYFVHPSAFNDPFDCRPVFSMAAPNAKLKKYYEGVLARQAPGMNREARRAESKQVATNPQRKLSNPKNLEAFKARYRSSVTDKIGLLCLSEVPNDPLMWSHYADSHRGICLAFDWNTEYFSKAHQVFYQKKRPVINPVFQSDEEMLDHALLTKSDHWEYEKEWRLFVCRTGEGSYQFPPASLEGIILGSQISKDNLAMVERWVSHRSPSTALFQAELSESEFKIEIRRR